MTTVAVVTPWLEHRELWPDYDAAMHLGPYPDELLIVDNGSSPPLEQAAIRNETNLGFCRASNQGLAAATTEVVVFLNSDVWASEAGWLEELADAVEPGVLAGAQLREDGHADVDGQRFPYLDGWCLAGLRDELAELGGFDEELAEPAYFSDNLLCLEARATGMTLRRVPVGIHHKIGVTSQTDPDRQAATIRNQRRYEHRVRALLAPTNVRGA